MQSVDILGINELDDSFKSLLEDIPEMRRELHEQIADIIKTEVDIQISNSGLNDNSGRVKAWQEPHVGSGGGYAAVRPTDSSIGANSPGAITNYLENGHAIRGPSGKVKNYRPRIKKPYVDGYHFYKTARANVQSKAIAAAELFADEARRRLEND